VCYCNTQLLLLTVQRKHSYCLFSALLYAVDAVAAAATAATAAATVAAVDAAAITNEKNYCFLLPCLRTH
jgi:hypothetical protein